MNDKNNHPATERFTLSAALLGLILSGKMAVPNCIASSFSGDVKLEAIHLDIQAVTFKIHHPHGMPEWKDEENIATELSTIDTAPKDGRPLLVWTGEYWEYAKYHDRAWRGAHHSATHGNELDEPTHWMPQPPPPEGQG